MNLDAYFKEEIKDSTQKEKILSEACFQKSSIKTLDDKDCSFSHKKDSQISFFGFKAEVLEGVFSLNNQLLLIKSELDKNATSLKMPEIFKLNRRENFRFQVPSVILSEVKFLEKKTVINDISSEGISFFSKDNEIKIGQNLNIEFIIKDSEFKALVEVKGVIPQNQGNYKIGVKFIKFVEGRQWDLTNIINRLAIQFKK